MSRREGRDSDTRRHRSRFYREPSPKRSRRDGKPETETERVMGRPDRDEKQLPSTIKGGSANKESDRKKNGHYGGGTNAKQSSDSTEIPRSRSYSQHDERGNAVQAGQSFGRRAATERGWWRDARDQHKERETRTFETRQRDEKPQTKGDCNGDWHHDRFYEKEADLPPAPAPNKKRPAFCEKKIPVTTQSTDNTTKEPEKASHSGHRVLGSERRVDRDHNPRHLDRQDRLTARDQVPNRRDVPRGGFSSHERHGHGAGSNFRGGDRFSGKQGYISGGTRVEKWTHDLFEEANKSPPRKNEEDQIAKVESLLGS